MSVLLKRTESPEPGSQIRGLHIHVGDDDLRAFLGKEPGCFPSYAFCSACNDRNFFRPARGACVLAPNETAYTSAVARSPGHDRRRK